MADSEYTNAIVAAAQAQNKSKQTQVDILTQLDMQAAQSESVATNLEAMGHAAKVISAQDEGFKAATDAKKKAAEVALSSDFTDQASKTNYWASEVHENAAKAYASLDAINEKKQLNLLSDPLGFIQAQFTLPSDIAQHNYYASKHNIADNALSELIKGTTDAAVMASRMEQSTSATKAAAEQDKIGFAASAEAARIRAASAGTRINGLTALNSLDQQQANMAFTVLNAKTAQQHLAISQQNAADQHAMRVMQQAEFADKMQNKQDDRDTMTYAMEQRNAGARLAGRAEITDLKLFKM